GPVQDMQGWPLVEVSAHATTPGVVIPYLLVFKDGASAPLWTQKDAQGEYVAASETPVMTSQQRLQLGAGIYDFKLQGVGSETHCTMNLNPLGPQDTPMTVPPTPGPTGVVITLTADQYQNH